MRGISALSIPGPVKQVTRSISKTVRSYRGNFRRLTDLVRATIVFETFLDIQNFLQALHHKSKCSDDDKELSNKIMRIMRVRNRFDPSPLYSKQLFGGYRDISLKIKMGFVCVRTAAFTDRVKFVPMNRWRDHHTKTLVFEIQLHHMEMQLGDNISDKEKYHNMYVKSRDWMSV